jgi:hypothetical protein
MGMEERMVRHHITNLAKQGYVRPREAENQRDRRKFRIRPGNRVLAQSVTAAYKA